MPGAVDQRLIDHVAGNRAGSRSDRAANGTEEAAEIGTGSLQSNYGSTKMEELWYAPTMSAATIALTLILWTCWTGCARDRLRGYLTMAEGSPLCPLLNEINIAAANGLPFLAVGMTVTLPDICVSLSSTDGRTKGERYKAWCNANLPQDKLSLVSADDLWSMRCGVLHNGRFGDLKHSVARVIFALPNSGAAFVNCQINDACFYSVVDFCKLFTDSVHRWFEANKGDATIAANVPRLMQYRQDGLAPYIVGPTVLA
ncbi:hypothetical protein [Mesorhizobium sp. A623]